MILDRQNIARVFAVFALIAGGYGNVVTNMNARAQEQTSAEVGTSDSARETGANAVNDETATSARYPGFEEIEGVLKALDQEDERVNVQVEGYSPQGRPVYSVTLSDPETSSDEKQHVVLSAVHAGWERSAAATLFGVMRWLLSRDPAAVEVMRRQVIVCLPVMLPDGYVEGPRGRSARRNQSAHDRTYRNWGVAGIQDPASLPEGAALQQILDRYQPDLYVDVHGISLDSDDGLMLESSASSPTTASSRPYHGAIGRMMDQAALEGGFPSDFQDDDREVLCWHREISDFERRLSRKRFRWGPGLYVYLNYHTLCVLMEITWQRSGLLRFQRLLRVGNERWDGELYPGYPNRIVGPSGKYRKIAAYGQTAKQLRISRVELWRKHDQLDAGGMNPPITGRAMGVFTLSSRASVDWLRGGAHDARARAHYRKALTANEFATRIERCSAINAGYIREFLSGWPGGQNHPEPILLSGGSGGGAREKAEEPIKNGVALRLRIPFADADIRDVRLNGHPLAESPEDGYDIWKARGFTFVQVNIPPARSLIEDFFIVTCEYDPGENRVYWDWTEWAEFEKISP